MTILTTGPVIQIHVPPSKPGSQLRYFTLHRATTLHQHTQCVDEHGRTFETIVCLPCLTQPQNLQSAQDVVNPKGRS